MKLLARYSRINLAITIIIFLVSSAAYYFLLQFILIQQIDDDLAIEEQEIFSYVKKYDKLPEVMQVNDQKIAFVPQNNLFDRRKFSTEKLTENKKTENYRQLAFGVTTSAKNFKVTVAKSLEDTDDLIHSILLITFLTILLILAASFVVNRLILKKVWQPFYRTLDKAKHFKLGDGNHFVLERNKVEEFAIMNNTIEKLVQQAQTDFQSLKAFSENAAHETQTPLAVIRSKLDLLIQDEDLTEKQSTALQGIYAAVEKLRKLNQSLLLLTKIENKQFADKQVIDLDVKLEEKIGEFQELWASQNITLHSKLQPATVMANEQLLEILLNNLLSNASRYNYSGGKISIELIKGQLSISNTSLEPAIAPSFLYKRFYKASTNNNHNGLGLSIVKQVCDDTGISIQYVATEGLHAFIMNW